MCMGEQARARVCVCVCVNIPKTHLTNTNVCIFDTEMRRNIFRP